VRQVVKNENYIYAAASDNGLAVIDITDVANPNWLTSNETYYGEAVGVGGNVAALSKWDDVFFFDLTDPANPVLKGNLGDALNIEDWHGVGAGGIAISGNHAFIVNADTLRLFDISNLDAPAFVGKIAISEEWDGAVSVSGDYAYVADGSGGLRVIDVTDPANPTEVGYFDGAPFARGVTAAGAYAYVAEKSDGVTVYKNDLVTSIKETGVKQIPELFSLKQNYPNPFNPTTIITYEIANPAVVKLEVLNVTGQSVATLVNQKQVAGIFTVEFDGHNLPSGVYFYKLQAGEVQQLRKMILMK